MDAEQHEGWEHVGWSYMLGHDPIPYLCVGKPLSHYEKRDIRPVYRRIASASADYPQAPGGEA